MDKTLAPEGASVRQRMGRLGGRAAGRVPPLLFTTAAAIIEATPPRVRYPIAALAGRVCYYLMPRTRRIALQNYAQVLGGRPDEARVKRVARHAFGNYAKMVTDFILMPNLSAPDIRRMIQPQGVEHLDQALAAGRGAILIMPHLGSWDLAAASASVHGYVINAVTETLRLTQLNRLIVRARERIGMRVVPVEPNPVRRLLGALHRNEPVALICDLNKGNPGGVSVNFFNRRTLLPGGPVALALKTGAPIIPVWARRLPNNRYVVQVEPALKLRTSDNPGLDLTTNIEAVARFFERAIRTAPDQWYVFMPVWEP
jgi:KDO2-lipid IV(A) lauroyltransferase